MRLPAVAGANAVVLSLGILSATRSVEAVPQIVVDHTCTQVDSISQADLDRVRKLDIFFCHASVGMGMVSGLRALARSVPARYSLNVPGPGTAATWFDSNDGLVDNQDWAGKGGNGNPLGKIQGFVEFLDNRGFGTRADVALMKFCYLDIGASTDVAKVWAAYRDAMLGLERRHSGVTFVWTTAALNSLGTAGAKRAEFNKSVRDYCRANAKPLFDLAALESHDPDGNLALDDYGQETIYAGYTDDNAHLASIGRERVARAMWWLFARIAGWQVKASSAKLAASSPALGATGTATARVTASLFDSGNQLFDRNRETQLTFALSGPGQLVGPNPVVTQEGTARITYRAGSQVGKATITASGAGLTAGQVEIQLFANRAPTAATNLLTDGRKDPTGLPHGDPDLSWQFQDPDRSLGDAPSGYRVLLSDNATDIARDIGNVWDSGKVLSTASVANPRLVPLRPGVRYYWKVRTWDVSDSAAPWSAPASFDLAGKLGYAARIDEVTGKVLLGNNTSLDIHAGNAAGITIEMWICRTQDGHPSVLFDRFVVDGGGYRVGIDASDHVYFRTQAKHDRRVTAMGKKLLRGEWHHVACQTAGGAGTIFVDGVQQGRNGLINIPRTTGARNAWLDAGGWLIDELRISNVERYSGPFTPPSKRLLPDSNTMALWHFDEGSKTAATDASGHGNTGTVDAGSGWGAGRVPGNGNVGAYVSFGTGCGTGASLPVLIADGIPEIGKPLTVSVSTAVTGQPAALFTGLSRTAWGPFTLPLDLTPLGARGCSLLVSIDVVEAVLLSNAGEGSVVLPIPNDVGLVGASFFQQWAVVHPPASSLGLLFSRGGEARIGEDLR